VREAPSRPMLSMTEVPRFPPIYRPLRIGAAEDALAHATAIASAGAEPATFVWSDRADRVDCAIVLAPTEPWIAAVQVLFCGALGMGDALASVLPPGVEVGFAWPDLVRVNDHRLARLALRGPVDGEPQDVPAWLALGAGLAVSGQPRPPERPGEEPESTLHFEECGEVTATAVLESFSRHFLTWVNRWQDDGFAPLAAAWRALGPRPGSPVALFVAGKEIRAVFDGLGDGGDLEISNEGAAETVSLLAAMRETER
jgi:BirA family biotin operon repressor/biotin-[acetyl-CoA-carboxylase] ligase